MKTSIASLALVLFACGDSSNSSPTDSGPSTGEDGGAGGTTLSERYPGDEGIANAPTVLFADNFESGWGKWDGPTEDTSNLQIIEDGGRAQAGEKFLQSRVTFDDLADDMYISSSTRVTLAERHDEVYWRFYARFPNVAPKPHHWIRMAAGSADYNSSGLANTVPGGDDGFWFDLDANNDNSLQFYAYWYNMRSGNCNDGTTTPGCEGDQGHANYYGNVFRPQDQAPLPTDAWVCIEVHAKANRVGQSDGALAFYVDGELVGDYRPNVPEGTWLRESFHAGGCEFSACETPTPFEGFDFRSSPDVGFKSLFLDAYYEQGSAARKRMYLEEQGLTVSTEQVVEYDDVVVASERVGCMQ